MGGKAKITPIKVFKRVPQSVSSVIHFFISLENMNGGIPQYLLADFGRMQPVHYNQLPLKFYILI